MNAYSPVFLADDPGKGRVTRSGLALNDHKSKGL